MRVALVAPVHAQKARGNTVTVARWTDGLAARGVDVALVGPDSLPDLGRSVESLPDLIHAHHAIHCGPAAQRCSRSWQRPFIVSLGGTDLNGTADGPTREALEVIMAAAAVVGPFASDGERLERRVGRAIPFHTVRRGVLPGRAPAPRPTGCLDLLIAGALRPVKGQRRALDWAAGWRDEGLAVRLLLAGPVIDEAYARSVRERLTATGVDVDLGELDAVAIEAAMDGATALLNASENEGASNAVLEAWARGRPVLATDVPGNREILAAAPDAVGCAFSPDRRGLAKVAAWLRELGAEGEDEARARTAAARAHVVAHHDPDDEIDELLASYRAVLG